MDETFLKESFVSIRIQAFEQILELVNSKLHSTSDPRTILNLMDEIRKMIKLTQVTAL